MQTGRKKRLIRLIPACLLIILILLFLAFKIYTADYHHADLRLVKEAGERFKDEVRTVTVRHGTIFEPTGDEPKAVVVFYPGAKVECLAYHPLMYELSAEGFLCILPEMPDNIPLLGINAADKMLRECDEKVMDISGKDLYIAGHSLGGVAGAFYAEKNAEAKDLKDSETLRDRDGGPELKGIIMCASYSIKDLSKKDIRLLSIYGSRDGVLDMRAYEKNRINWPEASEENVIEGGIHSYFGCYGIQEKDGDPLLTNTEQINETVRIINKWLHK